LQNFHVPQAAAAAAAAGSPPPAPTKSVVFSQFMGMLDLVQAALIAEGIPFVRLDGKTTAAARLAAIRAFAGSTYCLSGLPVVYLRLCCRKERARGLRLSIKHYVMQQLYGQCMHTHFLRHPVYFVCLCVVQVPAVTRHVCSWPV
jgi:hypothetical protein